MLVVTMPDAWHDGVSARTGWLDVSIYCECDWVTASVICNFCLSVVTYKSV